MSFIFYLLLVAFLVFIVASIYAYQKHRSKPSLLPTTNYHQYSGDIQSRPYNVPVEARSRIPHSILSPAPPSGLLAAPRVFPTVHSQQSPRKPLPPLLSPLPVAALKPYHCSFSSRDNVPLASIEQVRRPATKGPGQEKTVGRPLELVYRPSLERCSRTQKPQQNNLPGPLVENSHQSAAKSRVEVCTKPRDLQPFGSQDEGTVITGEDREEDDDHLDVKDLDHLMLRKLANEEFENMKKCQREKKSAWRSRQTVRARELGVKTDHHRKRMQELNERASEVIFAKKNKDPTLRKIDLHELTVKEAIDHTNRVLKQARELGNSEIRIIVGKGIHSKDGLAKLKPAIQTFLEKHHFPVEVDPTNEGVLVVRLDSAFAF